LLLVDCPTLQLANRFAVVGHKPVDGWLLNVCLFVFIYCTASGNAGDDVEEDRPSSTAEVETVPDEADFLLAMSTVTGHVSYRSKSSGSWFITALVEVLKKYARQ